MPQFRFSFAMTANQTGVDPLTNWQLNRVPWRAYVQLFSRATTVGVRLSAFTGTTNVVQRSPVQGGGTAGVTPSALNTTPDEWIADGGDRLSLQYDEVAGGTPTVDGMIIVNPV